MRPIVVSKEKWVPDFVRTDPMLNDVYEEYLVCGEVPQEREAANLLRFFCTFAVGCNGFGLPELGKVFSRRADMYAYLLQKIGYKFGRSFVGRKSNGFYEFVGRATYGVGKGC